ncbi:MAG TPA: DinB family protein [candidate division Zixibacteria bacterium]|nr:DinB family protein [candidate division Zixibacteria bacterium]
MSDNKTEALFKETLLALFDETFDGVRTVYLDKGTSFFETLSGVNAEQASRPLTPGGSTIVAHVVHTRFSLDVIEKAMRGTPEEKVDWTIAWRLKEVNETEWKAMIKGLRDSRDRLLELIKAIPNWSEGKNIHYALGALVHTAYHLGAIRQFVTVVKR